MPKPRGQGRGGDHDRNQRRLESIGIRGGTIQNRDAAAVECADHRLLATGGTTGRRSDPQPFSFMTDKLHCEQTAMSHHVHQRSGSRLDPRQLGSRTDVQRADQFARPALLSHRSKTRSCGLRDKTGHQLVSRTRGPTTRRKFTSTEFRPACRATSKTRCSG